MSINALINFIYLQLALLEYHSNDCVSTNTNTSFRLYIYSLALLARSVKARAIAAETMPKISAISRARARISSFCETGGFHPCGPSEYNTSAFAVCGPRSVFVARSPWHGKCARACALIESFVQNRTQLLRPVIQSGTMSSRPDTSLS